MIVRVQPAEAIEVQVTSYKENDVSKAYYQRHPHQFGVPYLRVMGNQILVYSLDHGFGYGLAKKRRDELEMFRKYVTSTLVSASAFKRVEELRSEGKVAR